MRNQSPSLYCTQYSNNLPNLRFDYKNLFYSSKYTPACTYNSNPTTAHHYIQYSNNQSHSSYKHHPSRHTPAYTGSYPKTQPLHYYSTLSSSPFYIHYPSKYSQYCIGSSRLIAFGHCSLGFLSISCKRFQFESHIEWECRQLCWRKGLCGWRPFGLGWLGGTRFGEWNLGRLWGWMRTSSGSWVLGKGLVGVLEEGHNKGRVLQVFLCLKLDLWGGFSSPNLHINSSTLRRRLIFV